jgi:putative hydrolase of the HAD superfamily
MWTAENQSGRKDAMAYLIWDFDNTLAHRPGLWGQCLVDTANSTVPGLRLTRAQVTPYLSRGFPWHTPEVEHPHLRDPDAWWASLNQVLSGAITAATDIDATLALEIATRVRARYLDPSWWIVFPDTEPTLAALTRCGWKHLILSNHVPELPQLVKALGLAHHFDRIITSATLGYEKPHPSAFKAALQAIPPNSRVVMIGDSFTMDYQGARAAGIDAILVRGSHPECETSYADLRALVGHLDEA